MRKSISVFLGLLLIGQPLLAADKPLVMEVGQIKNLPAATSLQLQAPTTANATVNLPHGTAPTTPTNGDCWTTTTGLSCFINSTTARLLGTNTGDQTITLTGDATGSGTGSFATTLATVNANVGTFGSATQSLTETVNGKGLVTAVSAQTVTPAVGSITGLGTGTATALAVNVGSAGALVTNGGALGTPSSGVATNLTGLPLSTGITGRLPFANLTQGSARSVLGVTGNATADFASIQGTADQALVINSAGTALAFGKVNLASAAGVTGALPAANVVTGTSGASIPLLNGANTQSGSLTLTGQFLDNSAGNARFQNTDAVPLAASSGVGIEIRGSSAIVQSYDRTAAGFAALNLDGSTISIRPSATSVATFSSTGLTLTSALPVGSGGTGLTSYAIGDIPYASASTTISKLADVATGNVLISGGVTTAPSWGKVDLTAHVSGILPAANGGTANGFTAFSGPATSTKTFTLPNASATVLTDNAAVTVAQGGTGRVTSTIAYGLLAAGTTATGAHQTLAAGATTEILVGGGASALPIWTTATGSGAPVRATSPALVTPALGTPSSGTLTNATGLPLTSGVTGTLPIANGGTNDTGTAWTTYTPTITCGTGTLTSSSATGRYKQLGKTYWFEVAVTITTNGTCATHVAATLPNSSTTAAEFAGAGIESNTTGNLLRWYSASGASTVQLKKYDNTYPGADGYRLVASGSYEGS